MIKMSDIVADIEFLPPFSKVAQKALDGHPQGRLQHEGPHGTHPLRPRAHPPRTQGSQLGGLCHHQGRERPPDGAEPAGCAADDRHHHDVCGKQYFEKHLEGYEFYQGELWEHSLTVAVTAVELRRYAPTPTNRFFLPPRCCTTSARLCSRSMWQVNTNRSLRSSREQGIDFLTAERKVIGFTHPVVGSAILKKWNFGNTITDVAKYHQTPERVDDPYVDLVALADFISFIIGKVSQKDALAYSGYERLLMKYNIKSRRTRRDHHPVGRQGPRTGGKPQSLNGHAAGVTAGDRNHAI
jgi:hypothetical protein